MTSCQTCGAPLPVAARFCPSCGTPVAPIEDIGSRRPVTIVFTDVVGSTALGERLDAETLGDVMTRYYETMRHAIEHHGGAVEKFIGDAVVATFGAPEVHEDDALRAVRAAHEMHEALGGLNDELDSGAGRPGWRSAPASRPARSSREAVRRCSGARPTSRRGSRPRPATARSGWPPTPSGSCVTGFGRSRWASSS